MNPLTNMKSVLKLSEHELKHKIAGKSWHDMYRNSAWIFVAGFPYTLTEGDIICVFSQYGEIMNINLSRDKNSGKSKGFCFLCYEDQRSTILAVDNLNGTKILGRTLRVDHVANYKPPKENKDMDDETRLLYMKGCAPEAQIPIDSVKQETEQKPFSAAGSRIRKMNKSNVHKQLKCPTKFKQSIRSPTLRSSAYNSDRSLDSNRPKT